MKSASSLAVTLQPSRIAAAAVGVATVATALLIALLPSDVWLRSAAILTIGAAGIRAMRSAAAISTRSAVVSLELGDDLRAITTDRTGLRVASIVQPESYVGAMLTTLVLRPDGARRSRAVVVLSDMMTAEEFRRLRVLLRHGKVGASHQRAA